MTRRLHKAALTSLAVLLGITGCSLVSIKSPERPLTTEELNARILTREFSDDFIKGVAQSADGIAASETDPQVVNNALQWKISATAESQRAALQMAPMMALLDTWTLAVQMNAFLSPGNPGGSLFANHQAAAQAVANHFDETAEGMAKRVLQPKEFEQYQKFVQNYTRDYPLKDLTFARPSVVEIWSRQTGAEVRIVDTLGTVPEAVSDVSDRMRLLGETTPALTMWKTELALRHAGLTDSNIQEAMKQLDDRFGKMSAAAESAPQLVHESVMDIRRSMLQVIERLDAFSASMIEALGTQRVAFAANVSTEREALLTAANVQRKAIAEDAARIADRVVKTSGQEIRSLMRQLILLLILLMIVTFGLPFAAGYLVGRARRER